MRKLVAMGIVTALTLSAILLWNRPEAEAQGGAQKVPQVGHMVYFTLKDNSEAAKQQFVQACKKYLSGHPGTAFFAAGTLAQDLKRPVNDLDFDVALQLVFQDKGSYDKYADAPRHQQFIDENKEKWSKVRVFDAYVGQ